MNAFVREREMVVDAQLVIDHSRVRIDVGKYCEVQVCKKRCTGAARERRCPEIVVRNGRTTFVRQSVFEKVGLNESSWHVRTALIRS